MLPTERASLLTSIAKSISTGISDNILPIFMVQVIPQIHVQNYVQRFTSDLSLGVCTYLILFLSMQSTVRLLIFINYLIESILSYIYNYPV